jgi:hypothetical protein
MKNFTFGVNAEMYPDFHVMSVEMYPIFHIFSVEMYYVFSAILVQKLTQKEDSDNVHFLGGIALILCRNEAKKCVGLENFQGSCELIFDIDLKGFHL